jgi:hypothetical protein
MSVITIHTKLTQLLELNTILSKRSKDYSNFLKINIYKSLLDFIDINGDNEFIKYFNKMIISFKSTKYYTIGNELQNSTNSFIDIDDFMFKIDNIKGGIVNNNIIDFYNELHLFIIKQLALYIPSKRILKKTIKDKNDIEPKIEIKEEPKEEIKKIVKKTNKDKNEIEPKIEIKEEPKEEIKKIVKKTNKDKNEIEPKIEIKEEEIKKIVKKTNKDKNDIETNIEIKEIKDENKKLAKKIMKDIIEPKKIIIEETKKKELSPYNTFFKEQSALIKDNHEISNKMEYIARLWKESKEEKEVIEPKEEIKKTSKKQSISSTIKKLVWNMHIGEEIGKSKCLCCKVSYITQLSFHCGHIVAESKGGEMIVSNLRPICQNCNSSMGNKNMDEFMKTLL